MSQISIIFEILYRFDVFLRFTLFLLSSSCSLFLLVPISCPHFVIHWLLMLYKTYYQTAWMIVCAFRLNLLSIVLTKRKEEPKMRYYYFVHCFLKMRNMVVSSELRQLLAPNQWARIESIINGLHVTWARSIQFWWARISRSFPLRRSLRRWECRNCRNLSYSSLKIRFRTLCRI